jgi:hypothetical protein
VQKEAIRVRLWFSSASVRLNFAAKTTPPKDSKRSGMAALIPANFESVGRFVITEWVWALKKRGHFPSEATAGKTDPFSVVQNRGTVEKSPRRISLRRSMANGLSPRARRRSNGEK